MGYDCDLAVIASTLHCQQPSVFIYLLLSAFFPDLGQLKYMQLVYLEDPIDIVYLWGQLSLPNQCHPD